MTLIVLFQESRGEKCVLITLHDVYIREGDVTSKKYNELEVGLQFPSPLGDSCQHYPLSS